MSGADADFQFDDASEKRVLARTAHLGTQQDYVDAKRCIGEIHEAPLERGQAQRTIDTYEFDLSDPTLDLQPQDVQVYRALVSEDSELGVLYVVNLKINYVVFVDVGPFN